MNTCVSIDCPFMRYCKHYNFLVDRGDNCAIQEDILRRAKEYERCKRKMEREISKMLGNEDVL